MGKVTANREAVIALRVQGPGGQEQEIDAVIDTGFTGELTLPPRIIAALGLSWLTDGQAMLANGQIETFPVYAATVLWDSQPIRVMAEEANTEPLVGMSLLYGYKLTMETLDGGSVLIERI
jgi:clan AA aspartic protease